MPYFSSDLKTVKNETYKGHHLVIATTDAGGQCPECQAEYRTTVHECPICGVPTPTWVAYLVIIDGQQCDGYHRDEAAALEDGHAHIDKEAAEASAPTASDEQAVPLDEETMRYIERMYLHATKLNMGKRLAIMLGLPTPKEKNKQGYT